MKDTFLVSFHSFHIDGLSLLNEDGGLNVFFPNNSFVTNSTLTHTNSPRGERQGAPRGNDHIVCCGEGRHTTKVIWHNNGGVLECLAGTVVADVSTMVV